MRRVVAAAVWRKKPALFCDVPVIYSTVGSTASDGVNLFCSSNCTFG